MPGEPRPAETEGGQAAGQAAADPALDPTLAAAADDPAPAMAAIQETFARMVAAGDDAGAYFYGWLFSHRPKLRLLFPPAMDEQRDRLLVALTRIVDSMSTPEEMAAYLAQLGRDHRKYSVEPDMYEAVGRALIATLRAFSAGAFTPAAEEAWIQAYSAASAIMIRSAEEASATTPAYWTAELVEREQRAPGIAVLTIAPDQELPFAPGQHITLQTPRWPHVWRPYSIACTERDDGLIKLHVKAIPGGWVSSALVHHTEPGDELILGPPLGTMTLQQAGDRDVLCVAGGTGLSPLKAITEQVIKESATGLRRKIYLFYGARRRAELYDLRDLWRLADAYDGLVMTPVTSDDPAFDGMQGNVGRVAARYMPHRECEAYLSGPPAMVRDSLRALSKAGIPRDRIHFDDSLLAGRKRLGSGT
jgi:NAD(P)H-flavin reductase